MPLQLGSAKGTTCGEVRQFRGTLGHHLVEPRVKHRRERVLGFRADLDLIVELLDEPLDVLDEHRLAGAVTPAAVPATAECFMKFELAMIFLAFLKVRFSRYGMTKFSEFTNQNGLVFI